MTQLAINLLPDAPELGRAKARHGLRLSLQGLPATVAWIIGGLVGLSICAGLGIVIVQRVTAARLKGEWNALAQQREEFLKLQAEQERLDARLKILGPVAEQHAQWSQQLNRLSDVLPDSVWLRQVRIEAPLKLEIDGSALENSGQGMQAVSKLLAAIQAEQSFTSTFNKITLQSFTTRKVGATDISDFAIVCELQVAKPPVDPAAAEPKSKRRSRGKAKDSGGRTGKSSGRRAPEAP